MEAKQMKERFSLAITAAVTSRPTRGSSCLELNQRWEDIESHNNVRWVNPSGSKRGGFVDGESIITNFRCLRPYQLSLRDTLSCILQIG